MKRKDITELHQLDVKELEQKLVALQTEIAKAKLEKRVGRLENVSSIKMMADDIARLKTIIREKENK